MVPVMPQAARMVTVCMSVMPGSVTEVAITSKTASSGHSTSGGISTLIVKIADSPSATGPTGSGSNVTVQVLAEE